jgi:hypothetical protein
VVEDQLEVYPPLVENLSAVSAAGIFLQRFPAQSEFGHDRSFLLSRMENENKNPYRRARRDFGIQKVKLKMPQKYL